MDRYCVICGNSFQSVKFKKICSEKCENIRTQNKNRKYNNKRVQDQLKKQYGEEYYSLPECRICGNRAGSLTQHIILVHGFKSVDEYIQKYNLTKNDVYHSVYLNKCSERMKGENNPGFNHGGKLSPYSKDFIKLDGLTDDEKNEYNKNIVNKVKKIKDQKGSYTTRMDYWLKKGYSEEEASVLLKERQTTFNKEICIEKFGPIDGLKRWEDRQTKWINTLNNKSDEEKNEITRKKVANNINNSVSRAEMDLAQILNLSQQMALKKPSNDYYVYDLYKDNKIIEYNGDYWHCNPKKYKEDFYNKSIQMTAKEKWQKDNEKIEFAKSQGYELLVIWESDWLEDKVECIKKCKSFLSGNYAG